MLVVQLPMTLSFEFSGEIWYWRGPLPFHFVTIPDEQSLDIKGISNMATYGWGVIPVKVKIGETEFKTSLFPKEANYIVPIKASVRQAEGLEVGSEVSIRLEVNL